jgi:para-nitrobenzyl esterase
MPRALFALALLLGLIQPGAANEPPTLVLGETSFEGVAAPGRSVEAFLGIPFAQPPVGDLRWQPPQPIDYPAGARQATVFAPACFQGDHITAWYRDLVAGFGGDPEQVVAPEVSEDCLYLNLWRPASRDNQQLPIIVYVHGGSNRGGWSYEPNYQGHALAAGGAVVITVAYRLGPFGFFTHPDLGSSNFALQDIVASLEWVRRWAVAAGGDPARVTVMGESAGASNISLLLAVPRAQGLFQRLIHQSAGWAIREIPALADAQQQGLALQREAGVASVDALRMLPAAQVDALAAKVYAETGFDPVAGDAVLPLALSEILARGELPGVDLLIGSNADEWKIYLTPEASLDAWLVESLPKNLHERARRALQSSGGDERALDAAITGQRYVCPSIDLSVATTMAGGNVWFYYFSRVRPGQKAAHMGAYHGAELPYVFDTHDSWLPTNRDDRILTSALVDYWLSFASTGNPNIAGQPAWPEFEKDSMRVMQLDTPLQVVPHPSAALCAILKEK